MPWIESHTVLLRHRKVAAMSRKLSITPVQVVGHLHVFWHSVLEQQPDGDLTAWNDELIASVSSWEGDAAKWVEALETCKFLDNRIVHDWLDYAGRYLILRYRTSSPKTLRAIWNKHGRRLGRKISLKSVCRRSLDRQPDQPDRTGPDRTGPDHTGPSCASPDGDFEVFWQAYPRKVGKGAARQIWKRLPKPKETLRFILDALRWQRETDQWRKQDGQYIPHPTTYLRQRRWEDEPSEKGQLGQGTRIRATAGKYDNVGRKL